MKSFIYSDAQDAWCLDSSKNTRVAQETRVIRMSDSPDNTLTITERETKYSR